MIGNGMDDLNALLTPGMLVMHPQHPEWGTGQVQSNIGGKVTVNFMIDDSPKKDEEANQEAETEQKTAADCTKDI